MDKKAYHRAYYLKHKERICARSIAWHRANPMSREQYRQFCTQAKIEGCSHYGPEGKLQCAWPGCDITDLDMLTIDHIDDGGGEARRNGERTGARFYAQLRRRGYPEGYQTLCANHNLKKELVKRRNERMKYV